MAEGGGLEPPSPKAPVFKTGGLPVILTLRPEGHAPLRRRNLTDNMASPDGVDALTTPLASRRTQFYLIP